MVRAGADETDRFQELVAESGTVLSAGPWLATSEPALEISAVEADARLARMTLDRGLLGLRISRLDPRTLWLAVHHNGQRLYANAHQFPAVSGNRLPFDALMTPLSNRPMDPFLAQLAGEQGPSPSDRAQVADRRSDEFSAALAQGEVDVEPNALSRLFLRADDPVPRLLSLLDATDAEKLLREGLAAPGVGVFIGGSAGARSAVMQGCLVPGLVAVGTFVAAALWMKSNGGSPIISLLFGTAAALTAGRLAARFTTRALAPRTNFHPAATLHWASAESPTAGKPPQPPSPDAAVTWGGLFYLLRDIAFFSGWDRPRGPAALYIDAWGMGPPELVRALDEVADERRSAEPFYELAGRLLDIRQRAVAAHVEKRAIPKDALLEEVRSVIRAAVT